MAEIPTLKQEIWQDIEESLKRAEVDDLSVLKGGVADHHFEAVGLVEELPGTQWYLDAGFRDVQEELKRLEEGDTASAGEQSPVVVKGGASLAVTLHNDEHDLSIDAYAIFYDRQPDDEMMEWYCRGHEETRALLHFGKQEDLHHLLTEHVQMTSLPDFDTLEPDVIAHVGGIWAAAGREFHPRDFAQKVLDRTDTAEHFLQALSSMGLIEPMDPDSISEEDGGD